MAAISSKEHNVSVNVVIMHQPFLLLQKWSPLSAAILCWWCHLEPVFAMTGSNTKPLLAHALPHFNWKKSYIQSKLLVKGVHRDTPEDRFHHNMIELNGSDLRSLTNTPPFIAGKGRCPNNRECAAVSGNKKFFKQQDDFQFWFLQHNELSQHWHPMPKSSTFFLSLSPISHFRDSQQSSSISSLLSGLSACRHKKHIF